MKPTKTARSARRWPRNGIRGTAFVVVIVLVAGGAFMWAAARGGDSAPNTVAARAGGELPAFAHSSGATLAGYQAAVANQDLFMKMPCYCGCGMHATAHHNLKECFIKPDGTYESHASACQTCVNIAADVMTLKGQGLSTKDIRQNVDAKYSKYGPSTDTPPVTDS